MNEYSTNEGLFLEGMRRFAAEVAKSKSVDQEELEKLMRFYEKPAPAPVPAPEADSPQSTQPSVVPKPKDDPLLLLSQTEALVLQRVQRKVSPEIKSHPFFKRVAEIARKRWSDEMQELFYGHTYLTQVRIGICPEHEPSPKVLEIILEAKKTAPLYQGLALRSSRKGSAISGTSVPRARVATNSSSLADVIGEFTKKHW